MVNIHIAEGLKSGSVLLCFLYNLLWEYTLIYIGDVHYLQFHTDQQQGRDEWDDYGGAMCEIICMF